MGAGLSPTPQSPQNSLEIYEFENPNIYQVDGNVSFLSENSESESCHENDAGIIPVHISEARPVKSTFSDRGKHVRKTVRRNNIILQSISLPVVMCLNPRSLYNKTEEFSLLLEQYEADVI